MVEFYHLHPWDFNFLPAKFALFGQCNQLLRAPTMCRHLKLSHVINGGVPSSMETAFGSARKGLKLVTELTINPIAGQAANP